VNADLPLLVDVPERHLSEDLVGERARHDERGVTGSAPEVDESTLGEEDDVSAVVQGVSVDLGLDVDGLLSVGLEPGDVDLDVKVTDAELGEGGGGEEKEKRKTRGSKETISSGQLHTPIHPAKRARRERRRMEG
jgi:hypothetical protein